MVFLTVSLILFWLVRRLMRHKPVAYGRPAYGAQAAAQAICSTKLLVRLMVRPGFTARTACAGLCGFFPVEISFSATQYIYIYIYMAASVLVSYKFPLEKKQLRAKKNALLPASQPNSQPASQTASQPASEPA
jgi:hypothetical protein